MAEIYVDADACPVKDEIVRVAERHGWPVVMVSNSGMRPMGRHVRSIMVGSGFDAADDWIAERAGAGDIVVTADIRLAARCLESGASVLGPNGRPFSMENIGSALAMRELGQYLREAGEIKGHNPAFTREDRSRFLQALDQMAQTGSRQTRT